MPHVYGVFVIVLALLMGAEHAAPSSSPRIEAAGLRNVYRITDKLLSGSSPEGDEGFASLRRLGVRTVISVDGARPDVERAHQYGMRYVHLPIGYDGASREQVWQIAKAVRDLPGLVYIHCHHGKHRGPTAAASAHLCLDPACSVETAIAEMRRAGTDPHYAGLYATPRNLKRPTPSQLDQMPSAFPEAATLERLTEVMVDIDQHFDLLGKVRAAGWKPPQQHPDLDAASEALLLVERFREAARLSEARDLRDGFSHAEMKASDLESALRAGSGKSSDAVETAWRKVGASCTQCHAVHRDVRRAH